MTILGMAHFGNTLLRLIEEKHLQQNEFCAAAGISENRFYKAIKLPYPIVKASTYRKMAMALGRTPLELDAEWKEPEVLDDNVEPYSERQFHEIPTFDLAVACGGWCETPEGFEAGFTRGEVNTNGPIMPNLFRIRLRGDSMRKKYEEGMLVEFRLLVPATMLKIPHIKPDILEPGKDYYVQKNGEATFKRLELFDEERLFFRAINKKKYPEPIMVQRVDVLRMAVARAIIVEV